MTVGELEERMMAHELTEWVVELRIRSDERALEEAKQRSEKDVRG